MGEGFLSRLISALFGKGTASGRMGSDPNVIQVYVKCLKCGEKIRLRLRKRDEIQRNFDYENHPGCAFYVQKTVVGNNSRCGNRIGICVEFDEAYRIIRQQIISGKGEFISEAEYLAEQ